MSLEFLITFFRDSIEEMLEFRKLGHSRLAAVGLICQIVSGIEESEMGECSLPARLARTALHEVSLTTPAMAVPPSGLNAD